MFSLENPNLKRKFPFISQFDFLHPTDTTFTMLNCKQSFTALEIVPVGKNRFLLLFCRLGYFKKKKKRERKKHPVSTKSKFSLHLSYLSPLWVQLLAQQSPSTRVKAAVVHSYTSIVIPLVK